jgi:ubiquinone/menaquinone biosynthesis C-methylase UbiE
MRKILVFISPIIFYYSCSILRKQEYIKWKENIGASFIHDTIGLRKIILKMKVQNKDTICDIGGGWGYSSARLSYYLPDITYYEEDINKRFCNKRKFKETFNLLSPQANIENYHFFIGTNTKIPFADNSFKTVTVFISIHEFDQKDIMLGEIKRIMRNDGKLFIGETVYKVTPAVDPHCKFNYLSETELYNLLQKNGFGFVPDSNAQYDSAKNVVGRFLECYKLASLF